MRAPVCPLCGTDAVSPVVARNDDGATELRTRCRECERRQLARARDAVKPLYESLARLLVHGGLLLGALAAAADHLAISGRAGFGWRQLVGAEAGFLVLVLGIALRRGLLGVTGLLLLVLSLGADLLAVGHAPGFGWRAWAAFAAGALLAAAGAAWRRAIARGSGLPWPLPARRAVAP